MKEEEEEEEKSSYDIMNSVVCLFVYFVYFVCFLACLPAHLYDGSPHVRGSCTLSNYDNTLISQKY